MISETEVCVAFLHPHCYEKEWRDYLSGAVPSHRLWGQVELERMGVKTLLCPPARGIFARLGTWGWLFWQAVWLWRNRKQVQGAIAIHEVSALPVLLARAFGLFRAGVHVPLVILNFGLLHPKNAVGLRHWIWSKALRSADALVSLVQGQIAEVERLFGVPRGLQFHVLMGVDSAFVRRRSGPSVTRDVAEEDFVLAVGTNEGKDYGTLLEALPLGKKLVVVTDAYNARLITHHRCFGTGIEVRQNVPIHQLRSLYQSAKLIVLPLHDTVYGSGHTVFLENLALGKVMLVSQSRGMEGYARGGENCVTVPVGGTVELRNAIQSVMKDSQTYSRLGEAAAADADERFSVSRYAVEMVGILKTVRRRVAAAGGLVSEELAGANSREDGKHASV